MGAALLESNTRGLAPRPAAAALQIRAELEARFEAPIDFRKRPDAGLLKTGIEAIDRLTSGGFPRGSLSEICGPDSSGRTALSISLLGEATRAGEFCAWIDAAGAFDPASAAEAGIVLERLLWVDCRGNAEHALKSLDLLLQAGGFGLLVLDLADTPEREARRIPLASWFRLRHAAERTGAALVVLEKTINARSCSAIQLEMRQKSPVWVGKLLRGLETKAESRKHYQVRTAEFWAER